MLLKYVKLKLYSVLYAGAGTVGENTGKPYNP
jgi:hypothetical protein